jgi:hypothetical protein
LSVSEYEIGKKSGSFTHLNEMCTACILIKPHQPLLCQGTYPFVSAGWGGGGG